MFQSHAAMTATAASGRKSIGRTLRPTTFRWKKNQASKNQTASAVTIAHAAPSIPKRGMNRKHSETFDAFAQGCAMCYTSAARAGSRAAHALDFGILVLLLPTLVLFLSVIVFTFRRAAPTRQGKLPAHFAKAILYAGGRCACALMIERVRQGAGNAVDLLGGEFGVHRE